MPFWSIEMKSNTQIARAQAATLPRGWVVLGLAALSWLPIFAAWNAFSTISAILLQ